MERGYWNVRRAFGPSPLLQRGKIVPVAIQLESPPLQQRGTANRRVLLGAAAGPALKIKWNLLFPDDRFQGLST